MDSYSFRIERRAAHLRGGWRLQLLQNGVEVGNRVFAARQGDKPAGKQAYLAASRAGQAWVTTHSRKL